MQLPQPPYEWVENEVKEVGAGFWIRVAVDNISWYDLGREAAVIDALEEPDQADVVRGLISQTTGRDLAWVVNTHWDVDHIACNPQWKREGAPVIAHESSAEAAGDWEGRPDIVYPDRLSLAGQGENRIEMRWMGGTHTPWDCVLHFPAARVLHIADLFGWGLLPCQPTPTKMARLREIYAFIKSHGVDAIVCGHGPVLDMSCIERFETYFDELIPRVIEAIEAGHDDESILKEIPAPQDMAHWWRFTDWKHAKNIALIREHALETP